MPAGRPSKYDPAFCDVVIELGKQGKSKAYMAAHLNIARSTFDLWEHECRDFSEAVKQAVAYSQAWWEEQIQSGCVIAVHYYMRLLNIGIPRGKCVVHRRMVYERC